MATSDTPLHFLTIHQAGDLMRRGELSPVELTRACLDRIADTDDRLHSFILLMADDAMEQARVAEAEMLRGEYRSRMHGIPFALKDLYDTAGVRTTSGSRVDIDRVPTEDATTTAQAQGGRRHPAGQAGDARVRPGRPRLDHALRAGLQPVEPGPHHRRFQQWFRFVGGVGPGPGRAGLLHRRVDTRPGLAVRHRGPETHLRPGQPRRRGHAQLVPGSRRAP